MTEYLIAAFAVLGALIILLAAVGIIRMPDLYLRMSVTAKAATLGTGLLLIASALYFQTTGITSRVIAIIVFIVLTVPVGAHLISRASYFTGVPLWDGTVMDDLKGKYRRTTHELESNEQSDEPEAPESVGE